MRIIIIIIPMSEIGRWKLRKANGLANGHISWMRRTWYSSPCVWLQSPSVHYCTTLPHFQIVSMCTPAQLPYSEIFSAFSLTKFSNLESEFPGHSLSGPFPILYSNISTHKAFFTSARLSLSQIFLPPCVCLCWSLCLELILTPSSNPCPLPRSKSYVPFKIQIKIAASFQNLPWPPPQSPLSFLLCLKVEGLVSLNLHMEGSGNLLNKLSLSTLDNGYSNSCFSHPAKPGSLRWVTFCSPLYSLLTVSVK